MENHLILKFGKELKPILIDKITHITCSGCVCTLHLVSKKQLKQTKLMKIFEKELCNKCFVRVHRNIMVNINCISKVDTSKRTLLLKNNKEIIISCRKLVEIKKIFNN